MNAPANLKYLAMDQREDGIAAENDTAFVR